jgi:hypothetical protein
MKVYYETASVASAFHAYNLDCNVYKWHGELRLAATNHTPLKIEAAGTAYITYINMNDTSVGDAINSCVSVAGGAWLRVQPPTGSVWQINDYGSDTWIGNEYRKIARMKVGLVRSSETPADATVVIVRNASGTSTSYPMLHQRPLNVFLTNNINLAAFAQNNTQYFSYSGVRFHNSSSMESNVIYESASVAATTNKYWDIPSHETWMITDWGADNNAWVNAVDYPRISLGTYISGSTTTAYGYYELRENVANKKHSFMGTKEYPIFMRNMGAATRLLGFVGYKQSGSV